MSQPLIIAVPSKGRLEENVNRLFAEADMPLRRDGARGYQGYIREIPNIEISYLSASEIATRLKQGAVHFGVTGEDLLREEIPDMESAIMLLAPLGFGHADVVVAIPDLWIDVTHMSDLAEVAGDFRQRHGQRLRVATKYIHLTQDFFARHGITDYTIVRSFGATEGAPSSGAAEAIVDITSTGATLDANQLRVPDDGTILKSQANLAASLTATWSAEARAAARAVLHRLSARMRAQTMTELEFSIPGGITLDWKQLAQDFSIDHLGEANDTALPQKLLVKNKDATRVAACLHQMGVSHIASRGGTFFFTARNEIYDRLAARLPS
jgi:ATP phosphoribosyltransferase